MKTGVGTRRIESRRGATCFVVTAAYGDPEAPMVRFFRSFRDSTLIQTKHGRKFVAWYYRKGPGLARALYHRPVLRKATRACLIVIAYILKSYYLIVHAVRSRSTQEGALKPGCP
ncbi:MULTISPECIES: CFI-box-CTERM domain-containing protein [unclassified Thiocapsa]